MSTFTGTVKKNDLEGGFWELVDSKGEHYQLKGGDAAENLRRMRAILGGEERSAASEAVALNTAAALYVADLAPDLRQGLDTSREVLRSGAALELLEELARHSQEIAGLG